MKTKITMFIHNGACTMVWLGVLRKGKRKVFNLVARDGWELAQKVNKVMQCILLSLLFLLPIIALSEPGYTKKQVAEAYRANWKMEYVSSGALTEHWHMSSRHINAKIVITFCKRCGIVTEIKYGYYCHNSGKRIHELITTQLINAEGDWYIQQPCLKENCRGDWILIRIEVYDNHYVIQRKLWKHSQ